MPRTFPLTLLLLGLSFLPGSYLYGQNGAEEIFAPLRAQDSIPKDFLRPYLEMYEEVEATIQARFPQAEALQQAYYQESLYYTHQLLLSGKVIFQDSVSRYVQDVAHKLLRSRPDLQQQLRFYVVRSPYVNAFVSGNGIILVNAGLIARLNTEAELAFILSHEIAHYVKSHALTLFVQTQKLQKAGIQDLTRKAVMAEQLIQQNLYSQEAEISADQWGSKLFLNSGYDLQAAMRAFSVLKAADSPLPMVDLPYQYTLCGLPVLDSLWLQVPAGTPDVQSGTYSPLRSTHPAPDLRGKKVMENFAHIPNGGRPAFLTSENRFYQVRDRCRFLSAQLYMAQGKYEWGMLEILRLMQRHDDLPQLQNMLAYGWYALACYSDAGRFYDGHIAHFILQGAARELTWLTEQLTPTTVTLVAIQHSWKAHQQRPAAVMPARCCKSLPLFCP